MLYVQLCVCWYIIDLLVYFHFYVFLFVEHRLSLNRLGSIAQCSLIMATGSVCPNQGLRGSWRRRKSYVLGVSFFLICIYVWSQYIELDSSFSALRPLMDAESEARRLLAIITHYNYQCNMTLSQVGNTTLWPLCASREIVFSIDDKKVAYTVG